LNKDSTSVGDYREVLYSYNSTYETLRFTAIFLSFIGWLGILAGTIIGVVMVYQPEAFMGWLRYFFNILNLPFNLALFFTRSLLIFIALPVFLGGLIIVAFGQLIRAIADQADNSGEMLAINKAQINANKF